MQEAIETRLAELRAELESGERQLELLDRRRAGLRDTLLRIGGAVQALEEILAGAGTRSEPAESGLHP
jgi:hypothetical protein